MKNILIIIIILFTVSCGQQKKNSDGQLNPSEQMTEDNEAPKTIEATKEITIIGTGKITTIADGFDVQRVNLFSSTSSSRTINCFLKNAVKVNILEESDPYYLVEEVDGQGCIGYCMKGFVILNK